MTKEDAQGLLNAHSMSSRFKTSTWEVFCRRAGRSFKSAEALHAKLKQIEKEGGK